VLIRVGNGVESAVSWRPIEFESLLTELAPREGSRGAGLSSASCENEDRALWARVLSSLSAVFLRNVNCLLN
jgi:hypothetical protein